MSESVQKLHARLGDLLRLTEHGLYCEEGDFFIDPQRAVDRAVITHAHSDHARRGSRRYLCAGPGVRILQARLGSVDVQPIPYGKSLTLNGVRVSLHPAGHILGSAQVRVEHAGRVWVVTGDYKTDPDPSCEPFELVRCHTLVTECTFGLPVYRWPNPAAVFRQIESWWQDNQRAGRTSVLHGYALGKAQRLLAGLNPDVGPIFTNGAVEKLTSVYRQEGIRMPPTVAIRPDRPPGDWRRGILVAPQRSIDAEWVAQRGPVSTAFASGWMRIRSYRRRRSVDRGFILSDHVDWPQLIDVVHSSGAERVVATHGYADTVVRYLESRGLDAAVLGGRSRREGDEEPSVVVAAETDDAMTPVDAGHHPKRSD